MQDAVVVSFAIFSIRTKQSVLLVVFVESF